MPKNKGIYRFFRTREELQRHDEEIRHFTRVFTLDHVTVALGRMGFRESKFREFDRVLTEVVKGVHDRLFRRSERRQVHGIQARLS